MIKILLLTLLLSACATTPSPTTKPEYAETNPPKSWQAAGKVSIKTLNKLTNLDYNLAVSKQDFELTLSTAIGLWTLTIKQNKQGLVVNNEAQKQDFKTWMLNKYGWYFPVQHLTPILFKKEQNAGKNWQVNISRYQQINSVHYPKIINFKHQNGLLKIKLLVSQISREK